MDLEQESHGDFSLLNGTDQQQVWLKSIENDLRRKESYGSISGALVAHTIFRVPRQLREVSPFAYEPLIVTIGPYKKSRKLQPSVTESFMRISAAKILLSLQNLGPDDFHVFANTIVGKHDIEKLIMQYERMPVYSEDALKALFALDASFIACFLVYLSYGEMRMNARGFHDRVAMELGRRVSSDLKIPKRLVTSIVRDLFLLENQVPLSLVKEALNSVLSMVTKGSTNRREREEDPNEDGFLGMCIEAVVRCVSPFQVESGPANCGERLEGGLISSCIAHIHTHLLDCLYTMVTFDGRDEGMRVQSTVGIGVNQGAEGTKEVEAKMESPSAVESAIHLRRAGIVFKPTPIHVGSHNTVLSIWFDKSTSTLYLPRVSIGPESESILRNLAAYEMVALQRAEVGSYLALMDDLIDNAEDVQVLRLSGVLVHSLRNDDEVAEMWNNMCKNLQVLYETTTLGAAYMGIKEHLCHRVRYKKLWELYAEFSSRYLSAPWLTASVLAATTLLLLTVTQTFYSAAIYYKS